MKYHFVKKSANSKTGPIPITYSERQTCPHSCPHYLADCYAEDYYTSMNWNKVPQRGGDLAALCESIAALPPGQLWRHNVAGDLPGVNESVDAYALGEIVRANIGRRGFTYTHKKSLDAIEWAQQATAWGFTVNMSADDAGEADQLADTGLPLVCIVPMDTPERTTTPGGLPIVICPAQTRDNVSCNTCQLCQRADRNIVIGFRAHGSRAKITDAKARRVIPIVKG
tara:strand:+ start:68 stop:745 length:678 start_codon:yes stop_codon:yes gene_type:complete